MKKLLLLAIISLPFACVNDNMPKDQRSGEYIVFGDYYGMCAGSCVRMFLLNENSLFQDSEKRYPSSLTPYGGNFSIDRTDRLNDVKDLLTQIPDALINSEEIVLGCPDCSDGGGLYVETKIDGQVRYWLIDKQRVPVGLEGFVQLVNEKISLLE
jgi:hypothetical protein